MSFKGSTTGTAPGIPTITGAVADSDVQITVTWGASSGSPTGYTLQKNGVDVYTGNSLSRAVTGLTASTLYSFRVRANKTGAPSSLWSNIVTQNTLASSPPSLTVFDAMNGPASDRPSTPLPGMTRVIMVNESQFYPDGTANTDEARRTTPPDQAKITAWSASITGSALTKLYALDVERIFGPAWARANASYVTAWITTVNAALYAGNPDLQWFFYTGIPLDLYNELQGNWPYPQVLVDWRNNNDAWFAAASHACAVGVHMYAPYQAGLTVGQIGYTASSFATVVQQWNNACIAKVHEAQRFAGSKPVYVIVTPQYLSGDYVEDSFWTAMLNTPKNASVNGIVVWGGYSPATIGVNLFWYTYTENTFIPSL